MILLDFSQVAIASFMAQLSGTKKADLSEDLFRHIVLNTIRVNLQKFKSEYGELVIAMDNKNYWRKQIFPYYKAHRKVDREASDIDWTLIFNSINNIKEELREFFPYKIIELESVEADDIIATLCEEHGAILGDGKQKVMILSGDKDYIQLQKFSNVEQFDPVRKKKISHNNPEQYLKEHILKGDRGDGIPNVLSPDDIFITGGRQKPLTQKRLDVLLETNTYEGDVSRYYERNKNLIDFTYIPDKIKKSIIEDFNSQPIRGREKLFNYFIKYKLKNLTENIGDF